MKLRLRAQLLVFGAVWGAALSAGAQQAVLHEDRPALKFEATSMFSQPGNAGVTFVDYVDRSGEPAFRFHVRHVHEGQCEGFLTITRSRIAYDASFTPAFQAHAFEVSRTELKEARPASSPLGSYWSLAFLRGSPPDAALVPLFDYGGATGKALHAPGDNAALSAFFVRAVGSFEAAEAEFHQLTAALAPQVPAAGRGRAALAFAPRPPEVLVLEPAVESELAETTEEKIKVRGIALDDTAIIRVEVAGRIASMRPRPGRGTDFWVDDVPLQIGDNVIDIVATNVGQLEGRTILRLKRAGAGAAATKPDGSPLGLDQVMQLLKSRTITNLRIRDLVEERGVNFELTASVKSQLRDEGADPKLLETIARAKR